MCLLFWLYAQAVLADGANDGDERGRSYGSDGFVDGTFSEEGLRIVDGPSGVTSVEGDSFGIGREVSHGPSGVTMVAGEVFGFVHSRFGLGDGRNTTNLSLHGCAGVIAQEPFQSTDVKRFNFVTYWLWVHILCWCSCGAAYAHHLFRHPFLLFRDATIETTNRGARLYGYLAPERRGGEGPDLWGYPPSISGKGMELPKRGHGKLRWCTPMPIV